MFAVRAATGTIAVLSGCLASCTEVSDRNRFDTEPTTLRVLQTVPAAGATGVSPSQPIAVCLSSIIDPRSVAPRDTSVSSGPALFDTELTVQLMAWTAPDGGEIPPLSEAPWCTGSVLSVRPQTAMTPGARYRLQMLPTPRGWAGETLETDLEGWVAAADDGAPRYFVEFTVDPEPIAPEKDDPEAMAAPTLTDLFAEGGALDPERANCSCHTDPDDLAWRRLNLSDPETAFEALVGAAGPGDTGFAMVAPRDPSQSFLLHKLLRDHTGARLDGILGDAMPPDEPLAYTDLVAIARWIEGGAAL